MKKLLFLLLFTACGPNCQVSNLPSGKIRCNYSYNTSCGYTVYDCTDGQTRTCQSFLETAALLR